MAAGSLKRAVCLRVIGSRLKVSGSSSLISRRYWQQPTKTPDFCLKDSGSSPINKRHLSRCVIVYLVLNGNNWKIQEEFVGDLCTKVDHKAAANNSETGCHYL
jgi:hypothetical protein